MSSIVVSGSVLYFLLIARGEMNMYWALTHNWFIYVMNKFTTCGKYTCKSARIIRIFSEYIVSDTAVFWIHYTPYMHVRSEWDMHSQNLKSFVRFYARLTPGMKSPNANAHSNGNVNNFNHMSTHVCMYVCTCMYVQVQSIQEYVSDWSRFNKNMHVARYWMRL